MDDEHDAWELEWYRTSFRHHFRTFPKIGSPRLGERWAIVDEETGKRIEFPVDDYYYGEDQ